MKHFYKLPFCVLPVLLGGCNNQTELSTTSIKSVPSQTSESERSYEEVEDMKILYSNIFGINKYSYHVYFYSLTCSHCNNLKDFIIDKALKRGDIYFVEASDEIAFLKDTSVTIGLTTIEGFGISGYPSIIKIEDYTLTKNLAGIPLIKSELTN